MLRAVTYLRLSSETDASTSIERQREETRARCAAEGWEIVEEYADPNISGGKARRNATAALDMLRDGRADVLVVAALDRWSRAGLGAVAELDEVLTARERSGAPALFLAIRDGLRSDQGAWRIIASVLSEVARAERDNTSARTTASIAKLTRDRRWRGGTPPYGYAAEKNADGPGYRLVVEPVAAAVLREAAASVLSGRSVFSVISDLNRHGVPSATGASWSTSTLTTMLLSPRIVGRVIYRGEVVRGADGLPEQAWEPLLDLETYERLRAAITPTPLTQKRAPRPLRLLSGLLSCWSCQAPLYVNPSNGVPAYQCEAHRRGAHDCEKPVSIRARGIEDHVSASYLADYGDFPAYERIVVAAEDTGLAEVLRAIEFTTSDLARAADVETFERLRTLQVQRDEITARPRTRRVELRPTGQTIAETWEAADLVGRRSMLEAHYLSISVTPAKNLGRGATVADRLSILVNPSMVAGVSDDDTYRAGRMVVADPDPAGTHPAAEA